MSITFKIYLITKAMFGGQTYWTILYLIRIRAFCEICHNFRSRTEACVCIDKKTHG